MNINQKITSIVRFVCLTATLATFPNKTHVARAEEINFDELFGSLDEMLKKIEDEEGPKTPTKKHEDFDDDEMDFKQKKSVDSEKKAPPIVLSQEPTRTDPYDLYVNPATQTITKKDRKTTTPTPATRAALIQVHNELADLLGQIETMIHSSPRLTPDQREQCIKAGQTSIDQIIVSLNFINSKKAYAFLLLLPPEENKKLVEELLKMRKSVIDFISKIKKQIASLQTTEKEELKTEEEKLSQLEMFAKKTKLKKNKSQNMSSSELNSLTKIFEELAPLAKGLGEFTKSDETKKAIKDRQEKRKEQEKASLKHSKEKSSRSSSEYGYKESRSHSRSKPSHDDDDDKWISDLFGKSGSSSSSSSSPSSRYSGPSSSDFSSFKEDNFDKELGKSDKGDSSKSLGGAGTTSTPVDSDKKDKKRPLIGGLTQAENTEISRAYTKTLKFTKDAYTQINDALKTEHKDRKDVPKYLLNRHIFNNLNNLFTKISSKKSSLSKENIAAMDKKHHKKFAEEEEKLKQACQAFSPQAIHAQTLSSLEGFMDKDLPEQEKASELIAQPLFTEYVSTDKMNSEYQKRDLDLANLWKNKIEETESTTEQLKNFKELQKDVENLTTASPTRTISTKTLTNAKDNLKSLKAYYEKLKKDISAMIERLQTTAPFGGLEPKREKINEKLAELEKLETLLVKKEKSLSDTEPTPSTEAKPEEKAEPTK